MTYTKNKVTQTNAILKAVKIKNNTVYKTDIIFRQRQVVKLFILKQ